MDEFAESTDATGSAEFTIDCSRCSSNQDPEDESQRARAPPDELATAPRAQHGMVHDPEDTDEHPMSASLDLVETVKEILDIDENTV